MESNKTTHRDLEEIMNDITAATRRRLQLNFDMDKIRIAQRDAARRIGELEAEYMDASKAVGP